MGGTSNYHAENVLKLELSSKTQVRLKEIEKDEKLGLEQIRIANPVSRITEQAPVPIPEQIQKPVTLESRQQVVDDRVSGDSIAPTEASGLQNDKAMANDKTFERLLAPLQNQLQTLESRITNYVSRERAPSPALLSELSSLKKNIESRISNLEENISLSRRPLAERAGAEESGERSQLQELIKPLETQLHTLEQKLNAPAPSPVILEEPDRATIGSDPRQDDTAVSDSIAPAGLQNDKKLGFGSFIGNCKLRIEN